MKVEKSKGHDHFLEVRSDFLIQLHFSVKSVVFRVKQFLSDALELIWFFLILGELVPDSTVAGDSAVVIG